MLTTRSISAVLLFAAVAISLQFSSAAENTGAIQSITKPAASLPTSRAYVKNDVDFNALFTKIHVIDLKAKISSFPKEEQMTVRKLLEIIPHINAIYTEQRSGDLGAKIRAAEQGNDEQSHKALKLLEMNSGPYDPWDNNSTVFNVPPYPANGFAYPSDLTKAEFDTYVQAHPQQKALLYSPYTIIQRGKKGSLTTRFYHEAYRKDVLEVAALLRQSAQATKNSALKEFLKEKANDLLKDDYERSYGSWIRMHDAPLDIVVGPAESYEDSITNVKENYTYALYSRDEQGADIIKKFTDHITEIGRNLPIDPAHNPYLRDKNFSPARNMEAVNLVALGGETLTYTAAGWTLPNEPEITAKHGTKMLLIRNVIATRGFEAIDFAQKQLFGEGYNADDFYWLVAGHELSHGMLPLTKDFDPKGQNLTEVLGELAMPVEEQKADLMGMVALSALAKNGALSKDAYWAVARMYAGGDTVYTVYRNPNEAHAKFKIVVYNLLKEKGAISYDEKTKRVRVNENFPDAIREITGTFLKIEWEGNKALAESLLKDKNAMPAELTAAMNALKKANLPNRTFYNTIIEQ